MLRSSRRRCAILLAVLGGCAAVPRAEPAPERGVDAEGAIARWEASRAPTTGSGAAAEAQESAAPRAAPPAADATGDDAASPAARSAPRARIDVRFANADVHDALRFLADAAGLSLVVADEVAGAVDLELRRVDPVEAMRIVAESNGAVLELRGGVAYVTARTPR